MQKDTTLNVLALKQFGTEDRDFYVNTISSHLKTSHLHINKPHKHNFYATFLFTNGSGIHEIDFNSYEVKPNTVFILSPGQTHNWQLSEDAEGIIFFHSQEFYETHFIHDVLSDYAFFSNVQNQAAIYLADKTQQEIVPLFKKLLMVAATDLSKKKQLLLSLITQIYIELEHAFNSAASPDSNKHDGYYLSFLKFQRLVEANFNTEKSIEQYADWMNMTAKHLNRINRSIVNKSTSEILTDRVILEAKRILIYGAKNISQVADELGFSDYAHFSKVFKNKTGQTPREFCNSHNGAPNK